MIDAEGSRLLADVFNTLTEEQKNIMPEDVAERIERFVTANGFRMVFGRWYLQCEPEVKQEPVAWVEVADSYEGPYEFHGAALLGIGKHNLYAFPPDAQAEIAKRDARIAELEADQDKANAAVAIGNYLGKTYNYAWCNTSLASQTIDLLKEQAARIKELEERRCEICGYAEHHREHTGCLRVLVDEQAAEITRLREVLAKCRDGIEGSSSDCLPYINKCKEALAAIKEEGL